MRPNSPTVPTIGSLAFAMCKTLLCITIQLASRTLFGRSFQRPALTDGFIWSHIEWSSDARRLREEGRRSVQVLRAYRSECGTASECVCM